MPTVSGNVFPETVEAPNTFPETVGKETEISREGESKLDNKTGKNKKKIKAPKKDLHEGEEYILTNELLKTRDFGLFDTRREIVTSLQMKQRNYQDAFDQLCYLFQRRVALPLRKKSLHKLRKVRYNPNLAYKYAHVMQERIEIVKRLGVISRHFTYMLLYIL